MAKPKKRTVSAGGGTSPLAATIFDLRCLMQRRTSLFCIACMLVCLASLSSWSAEQVVKFRVEALAKFGISAAHPDEKPLTFVFNVPDGVSRRDAFTHPYTMARVGGVMFTAVAAAEEGMNSCPDLKIDSKARDGAHLVATVDSTRASGLIFDFELIPTVNFVNSGHDALFTYIGEAQYDEAFKDNLVGLALFLLDNASIIEDFPHAHLIITNEIPGFPQLQPRKETISAWTTLKPKLSFGAGVNQMIFVDKDVDFRFRISGSRLAISGDPYWLLLHKNPDGSGTIINELKDTALTRATNPTIYDSIYRVSKYTAFFRHLRINCPDKWNAFVADLNAKKSALLNVTIPEELMPRQAASTRLK